jgi:hypothetical protein
VMMMTKQYTPVASEMSINGVNKNVLI